MLQKVIKKIAIFVVIGLFLTALISFSSLSMSAQTFEQKTIQATLSQISTELEANDEDIAELKESLNVEYIEKSHAFAYMIKLDPTIIHDQDRLDMICEMLDVDELHVINAWGIIVGSTIPAYIGFDMNSSDQAREFMAIVDDPTLEIAQEPQLNGAEGKLVQYVGVTREDAVGVVQVGLTPERLEQALADNAIGNVVNAYSIGTTGFVFAIDSETGLIATYPDNTSYIGTDASELGIDISQAAAADIADGTPAALNSTGKVTLDGSKYFYSLYNAGDYVLVGLVTTNELYSMRNTSLLLNTIVFAIIFALLLYFIGRILRKHIINSINTTADTVRQIAGGDTNARLEVRNFPEFAALSDDINTMVDSIVNKMTEADSLTQSQQKLITDVATTSSHISGYSEKMRSNSQGIASGATTQAASVEEITSFCDSLLSQVQDNSRNAKQASSIATESQAKLSEGVEMIGQMNAAMVEIDEASRNISQVIKTVSDIAFQTNILALNASVEAARAGEHGKGFAVVAQEVRNLAGKSADAASNTSDLIEHALSTVAKGQKMAEQVSEAMQDILKRNSESTALIEQISQAAENQATSVNEMSQGLNQISEVIQSNVYSSSEAEETANKLADEISKLDKIVRTR